MYSGIHAVLYALFQPDERIDPGAMRAQAAYCIESGCPGVSVLGLATEVLKLTPAERRGLIEIVAPEVAGKATFSVTIAGNSVAEQSELGRVAADNGADWLILQPPMAGSYEAPVYIDFMSRVAAGAPLPVAIQNAPQYLGRGLSAGDVADLKDGCANLAAIKAEDSAAGLRRLVEIAGDDMAVLGGRGGQELIDCLAAGARGFVLAPDIAPVAARILERWNSGRRAEASEIFDAASPAIEFAMRSLEHLIAYGKRVLAHQIGLEVHDRSPCVGLDQADLDAARRHARALRKLR